MFGVTSIPALAKAAVGFLIAACLVGLGAYLASRHYAPEVESLNQKLGAANQALANDKAAFSVLSAASDRQNASIVALQKAADARAALAASAVAAAEAKNVAYQSKAAVVLASKPSPGSNVCGAASALIDAQIREDRPQ
jgi:hypothetical protein